MTRYFIIIFFILSLSFAEGFDFSDGEKGRSSGNQNGIINHFETIHIEGKFNLNLDLNNIDIFPVLPPGIYLVDHPKIKNEGRQLQFSFSIYISKLFDAELISFPVKVCKNSRLISMYFFEANFADRNWEEKFFEENHLDLTQKTESTKIALDKYLENFSDSPNAKFLFRARFEYCNFHYEKTLESINKDTLSTEDIHSIKRAIDEYDAFIYRYPNREMSIVALQHRYSLCERLKTFESYREFLKKYPQSIYTPVAEEKLQFLEFQEVRKQNTINAYENFVRLYPYSPYIYPCLELCVSLRIEKEKQYIETEINQATTTENLDIKIYLKRLGDISNEVFGLDTGDKAEEIENVLFVAKLKRLEYMVKAVFAKHIPLQTTPLINYIKLLEIENKLDKHFKKQKKYIEERTRFLEENLKKYIDFAKKEITEAVIEELKKLQCNMEKGFAKIDNRLDKIEGTIQVKLTNIENHIQSLDHKLDIIHEKTIELLENQEDEIAEDIMEWIPGINIAYKLFRAVDKVKAVYKSGYRTVKKIYTLYKIVEPIMLGDRSQDEVINTNVFYITSRGLNGEDYNNQLGSSQGTVVIKDGDNFVKNIQEENLFRQKLAADLDSNSGKVIFYVHGFNENFQDPLYTAAHLKVDTNTKATVISYSWPSQGSMFKYYTDKNTIGKIQNHLTRNLENILGMENAKEIFVVAHSMGSLLLLNSLLQIKISDKNKFAHVIFVAPDIPAQQFTHQNVQELRKIAEELTVYASKEDLAIRASKSLDQPRLGGMNSFGHPVVIVDGVMSIDASIAESNYFHSHYNDPRVIKDLEHIFHFFPIVQRNLDPIDLDARGRYWRLKNFSLSENSEQPTHNIRFRLDQKPNKRKVILKLPSLFGTYYHIADKATLDGLDFQSEEGYLSIWVKPGIYTIRIEKQNFFTLTETIQVFEQDEPLIIEKYIIPKSKNQIKPYKGFSYTGSKEYHCNGISRIVDEYIHDKTGLEFVLVPGGDFVMGSNHFTQKERPSHKAFVNSFLMSKYEVTEKVWNKIMLSQEKDSSLPIDKISWYECVDFLAKTDLEMPSEVQWEYACRGNTSSNYFWGDQINADYLWYDSNSNFQLHPVGQKKPNLFGLYDTCGNVAEWCKNELYEYSSSQKQKISYDVGHRAIRGGNSESSDFGCRSAYRNAANMNKGFHQVGFRPIFEIEQSNKTKIVVTLKEKFNVEITCAGQFHISRENVNDKVQLALLMNWVNEKIEGKKVWTIFVNPKSTVLQKTLIISYLTAKGEAYTIEHLAEEE